MAPKFILWDVMDTLVHDPFRDAMPAFFGISLEQLLQQKHPDAWARFETGELSEAAFLASFFRDRRSYDTEGFKRCVRDAYRWLDGIEALLIDLQRSGVSMHALSNYPEWYTWIEERLGLSRYLTWSFVSCRTTVRKPNPAAFLRAVEELGCQANDCVFIDDRETNCEAARSVGLRALRFTGNVAALRQALRGDGLAI